MIFKNLKKQNDFKNLFQKGRRIKLPNLSFYCSQETKQQTRISIIVSKKVSKKAVTRNLIKRRIRALILENRIFFKNNKKYFLIVAGPGLDRKKYSEIKEQFQEALKKIKK